MRSIIGIFLFVIGVAGAILIAWPQWNAAGAIHADRAAIRTLASELEDLIQRRDALLAKRSRIAPEDLDRLNSMAPRQLGERGIIVAMEALAQQQNLVLQSINIRPNGAQQRGVGSRSDGAFSAATASLVVRGSLESFERFLASAERSIRLIDISEVSLTNPEGSAITFPISGSVYYRP